MSDIDHYNIYLLIKEYNYVIYQLLNLLKNFINDYNVFRVFYGYENSFASNKYIDISQSITDPNILSERLFNFKQNIINFIIFFCDISPNNIIKNFNSIPHNFTKNDKIKNIILTINILKNKEKILKDFDLYNNSNTNSHDRTIIFNKYKDYKSFFNIKNIKDKNKILLIEKTLKDFDINYKDDFINEFYILIKIPIDNIEKTKHLIYIQDFLLLKLEDYLKKKKINNNYINFLFNLNNILFTLNKDLTKKDIKTLFTKKKVEKIENEIKREKIFNDDYNEKKKSILSVKEMMIIFKENIIKLIEILKILLLRDKDELNEYKKNLELELEKDIDNEILTKKLENVNKELELIDIDDVADFLIKLIELDLYISYDENGNIFFKYIEIKKFSEENKQKMKYNLKIFGKDNLLFDGENLKEEFKILLYK